MGHLLFHEVFIYEIAKHQVLQLCYAQESVTSERTNERTSQKLYAPLFQFSKYGACGA